jgi:hypothetical protein
LHFTSAAKPPIDSISNKRLTTCQVPKHSFRRPAGFDQSAPRTPRVSGLAQLTRADLRLHSIALDHGMPREAVALYDRRRVPRNGAVRGQSGSYVIKSRKSIRWGSPEHPWSEWFTTPEGKEWAHTNGVDKPITDPVILARIAAIIRPVLEEPPTESRSGRERRGRTSAPPPPGKE